MLQTKFLQVIIFSTLFRLSVMLLNKCIKTSFLFDLFLFVHLELCMNHFSFALVATEGLKQY